MQPGDVTFAVALDDHANAEANERLAIVHELAVARRHEDLA